MRWLVLICAVMLGCGGGGPGNPNPPNPPGPTPLSFSNVQTSVSTNSAMVSWNTNKNSSSKVRYGTSPTNLNLETPEDNAMVTSHSVPINSLSPGTQYHYGVVSRDTDGTVGSANGFNFTTTQMIPPTLTFLGPDTVTVNPGATQQFNFTATGNPAPNFDCDAILGAIVSFSGTSVTYRAPTPQGNVSDSLTCTADNGINPQGVDSITIIVPFTSNGPVITSIEPKTVYFRDQTILGGQIHGANFAVGQNVSVSNGQIFNLFLASPTLLNFNWSGTLDFFDPGDVELTLSDQNGSATTHFLFKGNFDTMACSTTECFQVATIPGVTVVYDKNTGARKREMRPSAGRTNIAWDNTTGFLAALFIGTTAVENFTADGNNTPYFVPGNGQVSAEIMARDGRACFSRDSQGTLAFFDMRVTGDSPFVVSDPITGKPTPVAMATLGSQLVCATFSVEDLKYTVLRIPQNTVLGQSALNGLRKASELGPAQGGWRLKIFSSGSAAGTAALLHDEDKVVVFLNASTGAELRRVTLTGIPFRMEADEANGQVIIANWDEVERKTRFDRINVSSGQVTPVSDTVNFAATGMEICGSFICVANRDNAFARVPIN